MEIYSCLTVSIAAFALGVLIGYIFAQALTAFLACEKQTAELLEIIKECEQFRDRLAEELTKHAVISNIKEVK